MAEDYLTDDEQLEHVKRVVAENWLWVAGGVVLGAALIFGYRYYESYVNGRALRAAAQFEALTSALALDDQGKVRQVADGLIKEYPSSPYADQAHLVLARLSVDSGKPADAIAPLTQVMTQLQGCGAATYREVAPGAGLDRPGQAGRRDQDACGRRLGRVCEPGA